VRAQLVLSLVKAAIACGLAATLMSRTAIADDDHAWARFTIGSWKKVRVFTETLDDKGQVERASTSETKSTLVAVDEASFTLKVEVTVEVAGKRFVSQPTTITQGFLGEAAGQRVATESLGAGEVTICGQRYPTEVRRVTIHGDGVTRVSTIQVSDEVPPYTLRRETKTTSTDGKPDGGDSLVEVIAVDMPYRVFTKVKPTAFVKTVQTQSNGLMTATVEVHCVDIPGAVVTHSKIEYDAAGNIVRRSTLELIAYEVVGPAPPQPPPSGRRRLFHRFRSRR
jgi:hypothetical protein